MKFDVDVEKLTQYLATRARRTVLHFYSLIQCFNRAHTALTTLSRTTFVDTNRILIMKVDKTELGEYLVLDHSSPTFRHANVISQVIDDTSRVMASARTFSRLLSRHGRNGTFIVRFDNSPADLWPNKARWASRRVARRRIRSDAQSAFRREKAASRYNEMQFPFNARKDGGNGPRNGCALYRRGVKIVSHLRSNSLLDTDNELAG